jgi:flagellar biosynthesis protein FliR
VFSARKVRKIKVIIVAVRTVKKVSVRTVKKVSVRTAIAVAVGACIAYVLRVKKKKDKACYFLLLAVRLIVGIAIGFVFFKLKKRLCFSV